MHRWCLELGALYFRPSSVVVRCAPSPSRHPLLAPSNRIDVALALFWVPFGLPLSTLFGPSLSKALICTAYVDFLWKTCFSTQKGCYNRARSAQHDPKTVSEKVSFRSCEGLGFTSFWAPLGSLFGRSWALENVQTVKIAARCLPRSAQDGPKTTPRKPQSHQRLPQDVRRRSLDALRTAPRNSKARPSVTSEPGVIPPEPPQGMSECCERPKKFAKNIFIVTLLVIC